MTVEVIRPTVANAVAYDVDNSSSDGSLFSFAKRTVGGGSFENTGGVGLGANRNWILRVQ